MHATRVYRSGTYLATARLDQLERHRPVLGNVLHRQRLGDVRRGVLVGLAVATLAGCLNDPRGFDTWVSNASDQTFLVGFRGLDVWEIDGPPASANFIIDPGAEALTSFVDLERTADGRLARRGMIIVMDEECRVVAQSETEPGSYRIAIDAAGQVVIDGSFPIDRDPEPDHLRPTQQCVEPAT